MHYMDDAAKKTNKQNFYLFFERKFSEDKDTF